MFILNICGDSISCFEFLDKLLCFLGFYIPKLEFSWIILVLDALFYSYFTSSLGAFLVTFTCPPSLINMILAFYICSLLLLVAASTSCMNSLSVFFIVISLSPLFRTRLSSMLSTARLFNFDKPLMLRKFKVTFFSSIDRNDLRIPISKGLREISINFKV
jgi:hypothetical protein